MGLVRVLGMRLLRYKTMLGVSEYAVVDGALVPVEDVWLWLAWKQEAEEREMERLERNLCEVGLASGKPSLGRLT